MRMIFAAADPFKHKRAGKGGRGGGSGFGEGEGSKRLLVERYLDFSGMVYDNQPQENDCRKAYQAF